jgi:hypothetical protein
MKVMQVNVPSLALSLPFPRTDAKLLASSLTTYLRTTTYISRNTTRLTIIPTTNPEETRRSPSTTRTFASKIHDQAEEAFAGSRADHQPTRIERRRAIPLLGCIALFTRRPPGICGVEWF